MIDSYNHISRSNISIESEIIPNRIEYNLINTSIFICIKLSLIPNKQLNTQS